MKSPVSLAHWLSADKVKEIIWWNVFFSFHTFSNSVDFHDTTHS